MLVKVLEKKLLGGIQNGAIMLRTCLSFGQQVAGCCTSAVTLAICLLRRFDKCYSR